VISARVVFEQHISGKMIARSFLPCVIYRDPKNHPVSCLAMQIIPAALITGIRSDLPGQITAQVTENVFDSPTGRFLLVPQGTIEDRIMAHPAGESNDGALRLDFDRRLMLQFRGSLVTSDAGLLAYRELDDALGLSALAGEMLADARTGRNGRHALVGF
jgi:hypothetical protein